MNDSSPTHDVDLQLRHILDLTGPQEVVAFFDRLGYPGVDQAIPQTPENLGITTEATLRAIRQILLISQVPREFQVYLFEVESVTVALRKILARALWKQAGKSLMVVTAPDYERLDFVLVDTPREELEGGESDFAPLKAKVLPRVYSVDRRDPDRPLAVRVLRRLTWTETDGYAQHEKLRAAFDLAHWSEPEFNNRALFSDHYLKERLPDRVADWHEDPKPAYQALSGLFRKARKNLAGAGREDLRRDLLDPALQVLGFQVGADRDRELDDEQFAGRHLYPLGGSEAGPPLALCLDFPWGRSLDAKDSLRDPQTPNLNPSVRVVKLLEDEVDGVPWIIVTNGQIWRLYGRQAHSRATNYYEIDVEEAVSATGGPSIDPRDPFRYFWLLFRRQAFEPREFQREGRRVEESLLTHVWVESGEYAKSLGDRLKGRIFDQVFEILARGFLASRASNEPPTQEELDEAFEGTLTFLYRLLFLLYAEARDLLPVRDVRGYHEVSLSRLRKEIGDSAGPAQSQTDANLVGAYGSSTSSSLYDRLLKLFAIIDRGEPSINVPKYNGGLFLTEPDPDDERAEARAARFLESHHLADLPLARALDLLARDEEEKGDKLVPIDYKSLGVRQLGSIYEGLLEFRLRVAGEPMAVVQGKGKRAKVDLVVPLAEARQKNLKIRRTGRSKDAPERIFATGEIYLENDKRERHATGSYYTPDFVVEYIVRKTLAPILQEKLDALRPHLREAEAWRRQRKAQADDPRKPERASKYDFGPAVEEKWRNLIDDAFDFKVLDPAMGSGHFLVEAVDFITDEILRFLSAYPWNPVFAHLQYLRHTILEEMESQGITIDPERLTDTHLLKRHVLKRCIFGVDLNPMAVELAKVSLWLDCFTLGAPLSFLEHHLKEGNSLFGATTQEARGVIETQHTLFGTRFAGLKLAAVGMIEVGTMPDVTGDQLSASRSAFKGATGVVAPFVRLLDLYLAHVFRAASQGNSISAPTVLLELIRSAELEELFSSADCPTAVIDALSPEDQHLIKGALCTARQRRFFHWELEFPEVLLAEAKCGFDAVIGNPPYEVLASKEIGRDVSDEVKFFEQQPIFAPAIRGKKNLYELFLCQGVNLLREGGALGLIVPMSLLGNDAARGIRSLLLEQCQIRVIEVFPQKDDPDNRVFPGAKLSTCILVANKGAGNQRFRVATHPGRSIEVDSPYLQVSGSEVAAFDPDGLAIPSCSQRDFDLAIRVSSARWIKRMAEVCQSFQGEVNQKTDSHCLETRGGGPLVLRGSNICRYTLRSASQGEDLYLDVGCFLKGAALSSKAHAYTEERLGYQRSAPQNNYRRLIAARVPADSFCFDTVSFVPRSKSRTSLRTLLALLNSAILDWYFRLSSSSSKVNDYEFRQLPIPNLRPRIEDPIAVALLSEEDWQSLREHVVALVAGRDEEAYLPGQVTWCIEELVSRIEEIEGARDLSRRSARSSLDPRAEILQEVLDQILFICYGCGDEDITHISLRLEEML